MIRATHRIIGRTDTATLCALLVNLTVANDNVELKRNAPSHPSLALICANHQIQLKSLVATTLALGER